MSLPFKRSELPAWLIFVIISVALMVLVGGGYLIINTYFNGKDVHSLQQSHSQDIQTSAQNSVTSTKASIDFVIYVEYFQTYLNVICQATPGCVTPPAPKIPYPIESLVSPIPKKEKKK